MTAMTIESRAKHFMLWRVGKSVDWDCSAQELADEVGVHISTVAYWAKKSGWKLRDGRRSNRGISVRECVDTLMKGGAYGERE